MTTDAEVSIGQVKRDISELVNRVAFGGERIVLTSRGKPKAALVSIEDYERLKTRQAGAKLGRWQAWLAESNSLGNDILARRDDQPFDVDRLWREVRAELEGRDEQFSGR